MKEQHYDLIFMDQMMPDMDGIATFEEMKRMNHQNKTTPVIAMTANAVKGAKGNVSAAWICRLYFEANF